MTTQPDSSKPEAPKKPTPSETKPSTLFGKQFADLSDPEVSERVYREVKRSLAVEAKFREEFKPEDSD